VVVCGAPALDHLATFDPLDRQTLQQQHGIPAAGPFLLVTYHPVTLEHEQAGRQIGELLAALDAVGLPVLFTGANADTGGRTIRHALDAYAAAHSDARIVENLGTRAYFSVMREAAAMVGNSSSGIIEAASLELPVVNVGTRQAGRERSGNTIDVGNDRASIEDGVRRAAAPEFRASIAGIENVYGDGHAAERIVAALRAAQLGDALIRKPFVLT
jgi:UDP-N-acetylglucosamine 2-epimerase (non-hydrolysing)/GDP/UDP-N,N'-diacetylbacillosamine 2-epimerase (hydrolysing)